MEDRLIGHDTAKLAQECGFNEYVAHRWVEYLTDEALFDYRKGEDFISTNKGTIRLESVTLTPEAKTKTYKAPTQSLLARWLREVHNIHVYTVMDMKRVWRFKIQPITIILSIDGDETNMVYKGKKGKGKFETSELAIEAGLQEALKLIPVKP